MIYQKVCAAAVVAMLGVGGPAMAASDYANADLLMTADALAERGGSENLLVLDIRPLEAFREGHIPGAVQIDPNAVVEPDSPVSGDLRSIDDLARLLGDHGVAADQEILLYDDKGGFHAARMFWLLEYLGHQNVSLLNGGLKAWTGAGHALETGDARAVEARRFVPAITPRRFASAEYILEREGDQNTLVVDVRPTKMYDAGHIPWAQSIPWKGNLTEAGTMKTADELLAHFAAAGVTPDKNVVVHCQSGLASSHSYVALRLLGFPRVRTYHRSWAEWGEASDLPKAAN